jgi:hypothetical protein
MRAVSSGEDEQGGAHASPLAGAVGRVGTVVRGARGRQGRDVR